MIDTLTNEVRITVNIVEKSTCVAWLTAMRVYPVSMTHFSSAAKSLAVAVAVRVVLVAGADAGLVVGAVEAAVSASETGPASQGHSGDD